MKRSGVRGVIITKEDRVDALRVWIKAKKRSLAVLEEEESKRRRSTPDMWLAIDTFMFTISAILSSLLAYLVWYIARR